MDRARRALLRGVVAASCTPLAVRPAAAAPSPPVVLARGWLRPVVAGTPAADAYVDVLAAKAITLVGFTTPWADDVAMLAGTRDHGEWRAFPPAKPFRVDAHGELRFALYGNVLRLIHVRRDALVDTTVDVVLAWRDAHGVVQRTAGVLRVRGLFNPPPLIR
ncbi:MAG: copper chaperone PCu(A)C [Proteobacteria bacterium]|nr:copper chaperone PCu(A)C [Pseudomonadota bacterium]